MTAPLDNQTPPSARDAAVRYIVLNRIAVSAIVAPPREMLETYMSAWSEEDRRQFALDAEEQRDEFWKSLHELDLWNALTPREREYAQTTMCSMTQRQQVDAMWRVEAAQMLLWALSAIEEIPPFDTPADHEILKQHPGGSVTEFIERAALRPRDEIEWARGIAELWHWRSRTRQLIERGDVPPVSEQLTDAGIGSFDDIVRMTARRAYNEHSLPACIDDDFPARGKAYRKLSDEEWSEVRSITAERHFALNWLCGHAPQNDWDQTPTDT